MTRLVFCLLLAVMPAAYGQVAPPVDRSVNMTREIMDPNGRPMPDGSVKEPDDKDCKNCPNLTVGRIAAMALNAAFEDERNLGWQTRFDRSSLAKRIINDPKAVLDGTETATIERLVGKLGLNGTVLIQVIETIDPNAKPGKVQ